LARAAERDTLAREFAAIALRAGRAILAVYGTDAGVRPKSDESPLTEADLAAERVILEGLSRALPGVPVVSEEQPEAARARGASAATFVLVDPLDGTREFLSRNGEFTVNIALVQDGLPVAGCVYAPAIGELYIGGARAHALDVDPWDARAMTAEGAITVRPVPNTGAVVLVSRSHLDDATRGYVGSLVAPRCAPVGSALKFGRVASGRADLYPRFGPTMEWDTAAGHAVLLAAGGSVTTPEGAPLRYGKVAEGLRNGPFLARGAL
jgi:3'(2'),5'-bisphosphate nucleotidase